jgi:hypothetical protein
MTDNQDRLEVIKQGLPETIRRDDWGGHFLTAEGEFGWPGSHVDWLIAEVERLRLVETAARNLDAHRDEGYATLVSYLIRLREALD